MTCSSRPPDSNRREFREPDERLRAWIVGGRPADARRVVLEDGEFVACLRRRIRWRLRRRQMLDHHQEHYREDAEHEALVHVLKEVFTDDGLRNAMAAGKGFDPAQGSLWAWLLKRADFKVRDWIRAHTDDLAAHRVEDDPEVVDSAADRIPPSGQAPPLHGLREALETLSAAERACLTVRYLPADSLSEDDLKCVAQYRRPQLDRDARALAAEVAVVRDLLDVLWAGVQRRFQEEPARFEALNQAQDRASRRLAQVQLCELKQTWFRRRLREQAWTDERLDSLAEQAAGRTLKAIDAARAAPRTDDYWFERWSCRLAAARELLETAVDALSDAEEAALPTIEDVCRVLGKPESAVEPALSRARARLRKQFLPPEEGQACKRSRRSGVGNG